MIDTDELFWLLALAIMIDDHNTTTEIIALAIELDSDFQSSKHSKF